MSAQSTDEKAAAAIGCSPSEFATIIEGWQYAKVIRHILTARILERIDNRKTALETVATLEDMRKVQGDIEGMRASIALINKLND